MLKYCNKYYKYHSTTMSILINIAKDRNIAIIIAIYQSIAIVCNTIGPTPAYYVAMLSNHSIFMSLLIDLLFIL